MQNFAKPIIENRFFGLNDAFSSEQIPPGYFTKIDNAFCSDSKVTKVPGSTAINTSIAAQPFNGLTAFEKLSSSSKWLVTSINGASNAQLYQSTGGNFTAIGSANLTNSKPVWFEVANDIVFGFNGSEEVDWDGTTVTKNRSSVPIGYFAQWFHNYLFVARTTANPNRLYWSNLGTPTIFDGSVASVSIASGGVGYAVGDVLQLQSGGGQPATINVTTVNGGVITGISLLQAGSGYAAGTVNTLIVSTASVIAGFNPVPTTGGSGATITITVNSATAQNFIDVNPGDSDQIMGLAPFSDELLVFKKDTIWSITGFSGSTFSSTTIGTQNTNGRIFGYGTVAPFSIVPVGNDVYFFSMLGNTPVIRSMRKTINGITLGAGVISTNIKGTLNNITLGSLSQIVGGFDGRYIYWAIPTNGSAINNEIIALDTWEIAISKDIFPFTTMSTKNASYFTTSTIPGYTNVYFADASLTSGLVFKFDTSVHTDNGTAITMDVRTRDYFSESSRKSKWKYLYLTYKSGTAGSLTVNAKIDQASSYNTQSTISLVGNSPPLGSFILGTSQLGGITLNTTRVGLAQLVCHYLGIQFLESTSNAVEIHKWETWFQPKALRNG